MCFAHLKQELLWQNLHSSHQDTNLSKYIVCMKMEEKVFVVEMQLNGLQSDPNPNNHEQTVTHILYYSSVLEESLIIGLEQQHRKSHAYS